MMPITSDQVEQFDKGIRRRWLTPRIVVIETEGDMSMAAIDSWAQISIETYNNYPAQYPSIFALHDLSHPNQRITPYSRQKAQDVYKYINMQRPIYVALVLQNSLLSQLASILSRIWDRPYPNMHQKIFTTRAAAVEWLQAMVRQHG
jgi:hypothetical protein